MFDAILPIFLLILLGYGLKRLSIFSQSFWDDVERLAYYILFPCLLISKMATADLSSVALNKLAFSLWAGLILISLVCLVLKPFTRLTKQSFTSFFQGTIRFNTYIGLALAENLFGTSGLVIAVIIAAILIPPINIFVVSALQVYGKNESASVLKTIYAIAKNPLILGCIIGIGLNVLSITIPRPIFQTIDLIGSTALPLGLIAVGAALIVKHIKDLPPILFCSALKLLLYPFMAWHISGWFELDMLTRQIVIIFCALPTASASYILAKNMGGDHQLMARMITFQTLLSLASLMLIFRYLGVS